MANQGIIHVAPTRGGRPLCGTNRAIMSTTLDRLGDWPLVCVKCQAVINKAKAKREAKAAAENA